jgi:hypothetical protein
MSERLEPGRIQDYTLTGRDGIMGATRSEHSLLEAP